MFKLSFHTLIVSSLLLSASAFAMEVEHERTVETPAERAQTDSALKDLANPEVQKLSSDDISDIARRFNRAGTGHQTVTLTKPVLESTFLDLNGFNKDLVSSLKNSSPAHLTALEETFGGLQIEVPRDSKGNDLTKSSDKATRDAAQLQVDAQKISARNHVLNLSLYTPAELSGFDGAKTRAMMKLYKVSATKSLVGFEHFAMLEKIQAIRNNQSMTPEEAMEKGIQDWLIHLKHNKADVAKEAKDFLPCTPVGAAAAAAG